MRAPSQELNFIFSFNIEDEYIDDDDIFPGNFVRARAARRPIRRPGPAPALYGGGPDSQVHLEIQGPGGLNVIRVPL